MKNIIKVAIVYDTKTDYGIDEDDLDFCDFSYLSEVEHVTEQLNYAGYETILINPPQKLFDILLSSRKKTFDIIFNMVEGFGSRNREGIIPAICEAYNICYVGSDAFGMSFTLHKYQTKLFIETLGVNTPPSFLWDVNISDDNQIEKILTQKNDLFPAVIKPNREGFSMGICVARSVEEAIPLIKKNILKYNQPILIEKMIPGMDVVTGIVGDCDDYLYLGAGREIDNNNMDYFLLDTQNKLDFSRNIVEHGLNNKTKEIVKNFSIKIFKALEIRDILRIDWRVDNDGKPYFLECTPLPSLGLTSVFHYFSNKNNITYPELLDIIVKSALRRFNNG
ncbi:MAG: hypothetical protein NC485_14110 [Ruminococcus flavefaciens]|nr:hypothetical protein [Ruminococcus flavefaciens]